MSPIKKRFFQNLTLNGVINGIMGNNGKRKTGTETKTLTGTGKNTRTGTRTGILR